MVTDPKVVERATQPYVAIKASVTMQTIGTTLPALHPRVFDWLGTRRLSPAGAPFWKYDVIDMERQLEVEVGVPTTDLVSGEDEIVAGLLPAGRYATLTHTGHPSGLLQATATLLAWAPQEGLSWDASDSEQGQRWGCRLEIYETDPRVEPDLSKWETTLAFRLAG